MSLGIICQCKHKFAGLVTGPLCQETTRTFEGGLGESYIWLEKLVAYDRNVVQLEFTTTVADGLILYQGPLLEGMRFFLSSFAKLVQKKSNQHVIGTSNSCSLAISSLLKHKSCLNKHIQLSLSR